LKAQLGEITTDLEQTLKNLNTANKNTSATRQDIFNLVSFALKDDEALDAFLKEGMTQGAALSVLCTQVRALRAIMQNPEAYATKLQSDDAQCAAFKANKTLQSLQAMLDGLCCAAPVALPNAAHWNLIHQLANPAAIGGSASSAAAPVAGPSGLTNPGQTPASATPAPVAADTNMAMMTMILQLQEQLRQMQGMTATTTASTNANPNPVTTDARPSTSASATSTDRDTTSWKKNKKRKQPFVQEVDELFEVASSSKKKK